MTFDGTTFCYFVESGEDSVLLVSMNRRKTAFFVVVNRAFDGLPAVCGLRLA